MANQIFQHEPTNALEIATEKLYEHSEGHGWCNMFSCNEFRELHRKVTEADAIVNGVPISDMGTAPTLIAPTSRIRKAYLRHLDTQELPKIR